MGIFDIVKKLGKELATNLQRKAKKPYNHYQSIEQAHEVIERHKSDPKRAPMNVSNIEFSKEHTLKSEEEAKERMMKNNQVLKHLQHVNIVSTDPDFGESLPASVDKSKFPKRQFLDNRADEFEQKITEVPRGLVNLRNMVDILHNHKLDPVEWNSQVIAEKFQLRSSDVENLVKNFSLLTPNDMKRHVKRPAQKRLN